VPQPWLALPNISQNIPGIVWIGPEQIEYFGYANLGNNIIQLSNIIRAADGTAWGVPDIVMDDFYRGTGTQVKFYCPDIGTTNIAVYLAQFAETPLPPNILGFDKVGFGADTFDLPGGGTVLSESRLSGQHLLAPNVDYTIGQDGGGTFISLAVPAPTPPFDLDTFVDGITALTFKNLRIVQMISSSATSDLCYSANFLVINGSAGQQFAVAPGPKSDALPAAPINYTELAYQFLLAEAGSYEAFEPSG
jgi:hypothetical protein